MNNNSDLERSRQANVTGNACRCTECGLVFNSETGFNRHRVGDYLPTNTRRCRTPAELRDRGYVLLRGNKIGKPATDQKRAELKKLRRCA